MKLTDRQQFNTLDEYDDILVDHHFKLDWRIEDQFKSSNIKTLKYKGQEYDEQRISVWLIML